MYSLTDTTESTSLWHTPVL